MKRALLTTAPREALLVFDGVGGNYYDRTDTYLAWTCALPLEDRLSVTCPPTGLNFLKINVPDVHVLEYPSWDDYCSALRSDAWDMVGISFYTWSTPVAIQMARVARQAGVREVWGGNYGVLGPGLHEHFDRLIVGPGERPLHQFVYGRPLPEIRHPTMLGRSGFRNSYSKVGYLYSKRGCNIGCTFCSTPIFNPGEESISHQCLERVLDAYQNERVAHVIIYDETFLLNEAVSDRIVHALHERDLPWICLTRADRIRGRVAELSDRGMDGAIIGVESFRDRNLRDVRKREGVNNVQATIRELHREGRRALGTFMIGFAGDTAEDIEADVTRLADEGLFACQLTILTAFHQTKLYRQMESVIDEPDLSKWDLYHLTWKHPHIGRLEMRDILSWAQKKVNDPVRIQTKIRRDAVDRMRKRRLRASVPSPEECLRWE